MAAVIKKINYLDNNCIIVNDGEKYDINPQTREFTYGNNVRYICYNLPTTLRTHKSICDYHDETFQIPAIIEHSKAVDLIKKLINISAHNLAVDSIPCDKSINQAYDDIKNSLKNMISSIHIEDNGTREQANKILHIFSNVCDLVQSDEIEKGILASYPMCYNIKVNLDNTPIGKLLEYLLEYIVAYNSYNPNVISYHSLNNNIGYIYTIIYILSVDASLLRFDLLTKTEDIIMHAFFSMFIDIITDKCGKMLFIDEKNVHASTILRQYHTSYPVLAKINSRESSKIYGHLLEPIVDKLQKENINLMPYLISYTMPDEERILYLYEHVLKNKKAFSGSNKVQTKWFTTDEYLNMIKTVTGSVENSMYDVDILNSIIPYFLTMFPEDHDQVH